MINAPVAKTKLIKKGAERRRVRCPDCGLEGDIWIGHQEVIKSEYAELLSGGKNLRCKDCGATFMVVLEEEKK